MKGDRRMRVVILGMHKSGTTLIARILHESGIAMGQFDPEVGYDEGNHYEREEFNAINRAVLGHPNVRSFEVVNSPVSPVPTGLEERARQQVEQLDERHAAWGFKDPRTCLTFSFWRELLPEARVIVVHRHPGEVWQHYLHPRILKRLVYSVGKGARVLRAWGLYNLGALDVAASYSAGAVHVLDYTRFMTEPDAVERLSAFLETPLTDLRNPGFYRSRLAYPWLFQISVAAARVRYGVSVGGVMNDLGSFTNPEEQERREIE